MIDLVLEKLRLFESEMKDGASKFLLVVEMNAGDLVSILCIYMYDCKTRREQKEKPRIVW